MVRAGLLPRVLCVCVMGQPWLVVGCIGPIWERRSGLGQTLRGGGGGSPI